MRKAMYNILKLFGNARNYLMRKMIFLLLGAMLLPSFCFGAYKPEEMCVIGWGDSANQLQISAEDRESVYVADEGWAYDTSPAVGPSQGFVDRNENIYFLSCDFNQLKAFKNDGRIWLNYSMGQPLYKKEFYFDCPKDIYIDSLSQIYILGGITQDYVALVDTLGNLLARLSPFPIVGQIAPATCSGLTRFYRNSHDVLTFHYFGGPNYTYSDGKFSPGGCSGWKAKDGNYYTIFNRDSTDLILKIGKDPTIDGNATVVFQKSIDFGKSFIWNSEFLGVDEQMYLYQSMYEYSPQKSSVLVVDNNYNVVDEIEFPEQQNKFNKNICPYMRPSDGNIYEFRVLDDALHVIRWRKQ